MCRVLGPLFSLLLVAAVVPASLLWCGERGTAAGHRQSHCPRKPAARYEPMGGFLFLRRVGRSGPDQGLCLCRRVNKGENITLYVASTATELHHRYLSDGWYRGWGRTLCSSRSPQRLTATQLPTDGRQE